jgi:hypothetical protein
VPRVPVLARVRLVEEIRRVVHLAGEWPGAT